MREGPIFIAVLAIALAFGCARKPDDTALVTNIQSQMFSDPQLKGANLQVASDKGQVTLAGTVSSDAARLDAYKIATQTPGVVKVNDQMTVEQERTAQTRPPALRAAALTPPAEPPKVSDRESRKREQRTHEARENLNGATAEDNESAQNEPPPAADPQQQQAVSQQPPRAPDPAQTQRQATSPDPEPAQQQPPLPQPRQVEVAAGSTLTIRMIEGVDSSVNQPGETFHASLDAPIVVNNEVIVPKGADVYVRLVSSSSAGTYSGKSELHLELVRLEFHGESFPLVSSTYSLSGDSQGKKTAEKVGGGAVLGAIIGAIAGGGKGAAIGAGVGGVGGGVYQGMTRGKNVRIPSETKLDFQLDQSVTLTVTPSTPPTNQ